MAKISLNYPDTGLTISISVKNRDTGVEDFSGTMTEIGTTREYKYDFVEVVDTDYVYVATVSGYSNMSGVIYREGGGLTTEQDAQLTQIYTRVDMPLSNVGSGLLYGSSQFADRSDHTNIKKLLDDQKEEIIKEIQKEEQIEKIDLSPILNKIDNIEKIDDKTSKETLKKLETIQKWIVTEEVKEMDKKEKERKEEKRIETINKKEQEAILKSLDDIEDTLEEIRVIQEDIDTEEINNIIKLLK